MQDINWDDLKVILAIFRAKSLAGAARKLGVNETTVARRLAKIENQLDARVFERKSKSLLPSQTGRFVVHSAERVELETQSLGNKVIGADKIVAGVVRLTAVPIMINHLLVPALSQLLNRYPELELELIADSRELSLTNRQADLALRLVRPSKELHTLARRIGQFDYGVYASVNSDAELVDWLTFEEGMRHLPQAQWIRDHTLRHNLVIANASVNDGETILAMVKAGMGRSLLPLIVGDADPELVRLDEEVKLSREIWLVVHPELRQLARINAVVEWLTMLVGNISKGSEIG